MPQMHAHSLPVWLWRTVTLFAWLVEPLGRDWPCYIILPLSSSFLSSLIYQSTSASLHFSSFCLYVWKWFDQRFNLFIKTSFFTIFFFFCKRVSILQYWNPAKESLWYIRHAGHHPGTQFVFFLMGEINRKTMNCSVLEPVNNEGGFVGQFWKQNSSGKQHFEKKSEFKKKTFLKI